MSASVLGQKIELLNSAENYKKEFESRLYPLCELNPSEPVTFISVGGGELGDLAITAAKRQLGGKTGGVRTVVFDRYDGCPAKDAADHFEYFNMMDGELLEKNIRKYVPDPSQPHTIYLEIEKADTRKACDLGIEEGYKVMSTPYGPLICMDRCTTKMLFDRLGIQRVEWWFAESQEEVNNIAKDFGFPLIVKPVMTSSGHGTSIVRNKKELSKAYDFSVEHARGVGNQVTVERFLPELKESGTEIMQIVIRHFNENRKIVTSFAPPVEHQRPAATYHESWLPSTISEEAKRKCKYGAKKIADSIGGLGVFAVEQFVIGDNVYNNEVANRPHDTGMITKWMLNMDEGALQLYSTLGMPMTKSDLELSRKNVYGVAHVVLAPEFGHNEEVEVRNWSLYGIKKFIREKNYRGDVWYFGKPSAYSERRMGLAVGFHKNIGEARKIAEDIAHFSQNRIIYEE